MLPVVTQPFVPLPDLAALEAALSAAAREPVLIFKHSATCGISAQAHDELAAWLRDHQVRVPAFIVHVRESRAVSTAIAERFAVRHESPQVLLVHGGTVHWHASHWHVTGREVQQALDAISAAAG